jgi:transcriptional regulator with XRE-family HTH domain
MKQVETNIQNFLPKNLRFLRKQFCLSQEVFAERIGLNRGNIASYENGTCEPKICNLKNISQFFQVSIIDLAGTDLTTLGAYESAINNFNNKSFWELDVLDTYLTKTNETDHLLESLYATFQITSKNMAELPSDIQFLILNFEQMFKASKKIVATHKDLLEYLKHKSCKTQSPQTSISKISNIVQSMNAGANGNPNDTSH